MSEYLQLSGVERSDAAPALPPDVPSEAAVDDSDCWGPDLASDRRLIAELTWRPAGRDLIDLLSRINPSELADEECVAFAQAVRRQQGWTESLLTQVTARFAEHRPGPPPLTASPWQRAARSACTSAASSRRPAARTCPPSGELCSACRPGRLRG